MTPVTVACIQPRMSVMEAREDFEREARRFLRQAQAKGVQLAIFPEFTGIMLTTPLISNVKLGLIKRVARGKRAEAGFVAQRLAGVSGAAAGALGGGFRGSLNRLLQKNSAALHDYYVETFSSLAQEFGTAIVGGSLYLKDPETGSVRHRAYVFAEDGEVLGYQDKFNLGADERDLATPGSNLSVIDTGHGRIGILISQDAMYPELARGLAIQGADLLIGLVASPGAAQAAAIRNALSVRAEENQIFAAASFLLGPNVLGQENRENYYGKSALLAPISLTLRGDGIILEAGSDRAESFVATELDLEALEELRETSRFRPRREMHLGNLGPVLAEMYDRGLSIEDALGQRLAAPPEPAPPEEIRLEPDVAAPPEPEALDLEIPDAPVAEEMLLSEAPEEEKEAEE